MAMTTTLTKFSLEINHHASSASQQAINRAYDELIQGAMITRKGQYYHIGKSGQPTRVLADSIVNALVDQRLAEPRCGRLVAINAEQAAYELALVAVAAIVEGLGQSDYKKRKCMGCAIWRDRQGNILHELDEVIRHLINDDTMGQYTP